MFVLNPDEYSLPCYRIGPFTTKDIVVNHKLPESDTIDGYLNKRFKDKDFLFTINGRTAINIALASFNLSKNDVVTILTTTNNFYISGCVTKEIEKFCSWSREIVEKTRLIFVNHEFGIPYPELQELKKYGVPVIEDCASSFLSEDKNNDIGNVGDFVIYSFPKMFPLQIGGLLVSNYPENIDIRNQVGNVELRHIKKVLSSQVDIIDNIINDRIRNYKYLKNGFESLGFPERFMLDKGIVPAVFMFRTENRKIDLPYLKKYYWEHGVQCSVFYGEEAFFIPVHQALCETDLEYFIEIMKSFLMLNQKI